MFSPTIDTHKAIQRFEQLLQPASQTRILRLIGEGKMGKTHLLTQVFPSLMQQQDHVRWALLDVSYPFHTVPDLLNLVCTQLGDPYGEGYYAADQAWSQRPKVEVKGLTTSFSRIGIFAKEGSHDARDRARHVTGHFTKDMGKRDDAMLVFLIDSVERANEEICRWLVELLLIPLARLKHVRVVLAGRSLPEVHASYRMFCDSYQLQAVKEIEPYLVYCQQMHLTLPEPSIRVLAHAFDYTPGLFAEVLPKFQPESMAHG